MMSEAGGWGKGSRPGLIGFSPCCRGPGTDAEECQNSELTRGLPGCYKDVFNKVGGQSIFHLTVC